MMAYDFYCPYCGNKQKQGVPIEFDEFAVISFFCDICDKSISFAI